ncbi:hypothetical protein F8388_017303 [Cannabis sativa]|uniref:DUF4228 domain-containing protein n=1 Tax=Cannabis sativa TaxID=3483 RepID=A0A7J6FX78_CANSA|nr:hypothetical protein F8388_017303 [Cannabis sativa]
MGNCQAAEAATVVIHHPANNKIDRIYWSVSAQEVMTSNPGHYVALVFTSPTLKSDNGSPLKQLKLLRPEDTLLIGQVYRLISFEDVLKEFAAKKSVKLGKLLKERGGVGLGLGPETRKRDSGTGPIPNNTNSLKSEPEIHRMGRNDVVVGSSSSGRGSVGRHYGVSGGGQWRPALQSISEVQLIRVVRESNKVVVVVSIIHSKIQKWELKI